jgi:hypothetical protein
MASREPRGGINIIQTKRGKYVLLAPEIRYPGVVLRESFALHTAPFRSRTDRVSDRASRADDEGTGVVPAENPGAGRTPAPGDDPQVRAEEREAQQRPVAVAGTGAGRQRGGSRSRVGAGASARFIAGNEEDPDERPASGTPGTSRESAASRKADSLHTGSMRVPVVRQRHGCDRLRAERAAGCGAGPVPGDGDQTREACLQRLRRWSERRAAAGADRRKRTGERPVGDRHAGVEVQRSSAAVPAERDSGAGRRRFDQPGDDGRLGDDRWRTTCTGSRGDRPGTARWKLHSGRRDAGSGADARQAREKPSSVSLAVRETGRKCRLRLPDGARARRSETIPRAVRRHSANRRLYGIRPHGWPENGCMPHAGRMRAGRCSTRSN